jgi:hypothetical protein
MKRYNSVHLQISKRNSHMQLSNCAFGLKAFIVVMRLVYGKQRNENREEIFGGAKFNGPTVYPLAPRD